MGRNNNILNTSKMMKLFSEMGDDIRVDILETKNPHIIASSNETSKWIFKVEGEWYFFNPKNQNTETLNF